MRPEMKEYNYDWLMWGALWAGANMPNGTPKETELTYRYAPYFKPTLKTFIDQGEPGIQLLKMFEQYYKNILTAHEQGKKLVAITFCLSPVIFYAMDVVPVCTELLTALGNLTWKRSMFDYLDHACELGLPETSCSSQRGAMGAYLGGFGESIDFVVCDTPGVCDTNANAFAFMAAYLDKPYYQLNYPHIIGTKESERYHVDDFKEAIGFIEEQTGNKLDYDRLAEVLKEADKQDALIADIEDMHTLVPTPLHPSHNLALYAGRFTFAGHKEYTRLLETIHRESKKRAESGESGLSCGHEKKRALLIYIDHFTLDMNFWNWFDERNIAHMGGLLSHNFRDNTEFARDIEGSSYSIDFTSEETLLNSVAQMNARLPMVRSIRGPYDGPNMWLEDTLSMAKSFKADFCIYNGTPGCRNTWANVKLIAKDLEKHGYPTHIMLDDAFDDRVESWDATRERLDEFLEVRRLI